MPARKDINSILIIGAGPIVIGQACEFDYSGVQACRALKKEGYRIILANSNPATIMTDPSFADATYLEPLRADILKRIIQKEKPDALLSTLGGQTALNLTMELNEMGALEGIELLGANLDAISTAEDRSLFKKAMQEIGLSLPNSVVVDSLKSAKSAIKKLGLPAIIRPAYILGGAGAGVAQTKEEFEDLVVRGLNASPIGQILIEESIAGWKEFELEVMRDKKDNCVVICSIENLDPMGVHTGDSITVAPIQTLSDAQYQEMRNDAFACIRRVGVETGGSNIQFAVNPKDGKRVVIEMNPRVSRSSALASKATGFPIAKIASLLAVGYTLDEIPNDITKATPASFEPVLDYVVTKIPRFAFEKLPGTTGILGASMQSVGEVMAIGRTFPESLQKGIRSLELGRAGMNCDSAEEEIQKDNEEWRKRNLEHLEQCAIPTPNRIFQVETALRDGVSCDELNAKTGIDKWFLNQILRITQARLELENKDIKSLTPRELKKIKQLGFSNTQLSFLFGISEVEVQGILEKAGVTPVYKSVDTCAGEFFSQTPYSYSTYEDTQELIATKNEKVMILGSGPNRIGQGIEFDYCCVHASFALRDAGYETIMVNCNPETVSTDYDTSDRLYFEPLTKEDVLNILKAENELAKATGNPEVKKIIVSLGGQTPLKLAFDLPPEIIAGTPSDSIDLAEDRGRWTELCLKMKLPIPAGAVATDATTALLVAKDIGYPLLVRPSYVLGGRAMVIVDSDEELTHAMQEMTAQGHLGKEGGLSSQRPVLIDKFLEDAIEVDVDALRDETGEVLIGGIMEHIEEAGVHSGDSACVLPTYSLSDETLKEIEGYTHKIAEALNVVGLLNVQYGLVKKAGRTMVFVLEANPRASRTVPFVSKATGVPLAKVAARLMLGSSLAQLRKEGLLTDSVVAKSGHVSVKEAVLPFNRFLGTDAVLGPEMRSTGEVMGIDTTTALAFGKSQIAAGGNLDTEGSVFLSLADKDKSRGVEIAKRFRALNFKILATQGTAKALQDADIEVAAIVQKLEEKAGVDKGKSANAVELIKAGDIAFVINTPQGVASRADGGKIRSAAIEENVSLFTTISASEAVVGALEELRNSEFEVRSLQEYHLMT